LEKVLLLGLEIRRHIVFSFSGCQFGSFGSASQVTKNTLAMKRSFASFSHSGIIPMSRLDCPPNDFRSLAHKLSDTAADYLESLPALPTFPGHVTGGDTERLFEMDLPLEGIGVQAFEPLSEMMRLGRPNSPRFFGYVFGSGLPIAALGDF